MAKHAEVILRLDQGAIIQVVGKDIHASAKRAANVWLGRARSNLSAAGRMDTGKLYASLKVTDITANPMVPEFLVGSDLEYAIYQEKGTNGARARPGGFLVFTPKGSSKLVFAKKVRGFAGAHYLENAVAAASISDYL